MIDSYSIPRAKLDYLLEVAQRAHARATQSPFWALIKSDPMMMEMLRALSELQKEKDTQCQQSSV